MNPITQQIIDFLTHPELPFGADEDVLLLSDPEALRNRVAELLEESPEVLGAPNSATLKTRLNEADWPLIAQEFRARIAMTTSFFEADTKG